MNKATKNKVVPLRIPEYLDELAAFSAEMEHTDKATALRQWLHFGAERYVLKQTSEGNISIGRAAELLNLSIFDIQLLAQRYGFELGMTPEQLEWSQKTLDSLSSARASRAV